MGIMMEWGARGEEGRRETKGVSVNAAGCNPAQRVRGEVITTPIKLVDPDAKNTPALRIAATATSKAMVKATITPTATVITTMAASYTPTVTATETLTPTMTSTMTATATPTKEKKEVEGGKNGGNGGEDQKPGGGDQN